MSETSILDKLKSRWGIESTFQVFIILIVFALTGFSALYVKKFFFPLFGITSEDPFWLRTLVWIFTVLPAYQVLLLTYGSLLGQSKFFLNFAKKSFGRLLPKKKQEEH